MFLTLEGVEGSGKSTLLRLLTERMTREGVPFLTTREPGGCPLGLRIRPLLLESSSVLSDKAELFLFLADRAQHVTEVIRPALAAGTWVVCDRYADSTIAYQGYGRGMDVERLQALNDYATGGLWPDVTFLLDLPEEEGLHRARHRNIEQDIAEAEGRFEAEELAFHKRVREGFLARAGLWPERFVVLDASRSPEGLADAAWTHLQKLQR